MTQQAVTPWTYYLGNGVQTTFPYPWRIGDAADLQVYLGSVLTTAYTVTGVDNQAGGNVIFTMAPADQTIVFLHRATALTQLLDLIDNDPFHADSLEQALDKLERAIQDIYERLSRAPALALPSRNAFRDLSFPAAVPHKVIGWNADGSALTLYDPAITQTTVSPSTGETHGISTATVSSSAGAVVLTAPALIPAGVKVKGVGYRVLTDLSTENNLASIDVGGMGVESGWGSALGITAGAVNNEGQMRGDEPRTTNAEDVTLIANPPGALFGATGTVKLTVFWRTLTPAS